MGGALAASFQVELHSGELESELLARLARDRLPAMLGTVEDSEEDLVVRLRDPRVFGSFAKGLLEEPRLDPALKIALVEHAFDLLPLPRSERDIVLVEARAPPGLLGLASFLIRSDAFSMLHLLHLVYAVFLDRRLVGGTPRAVRTAVLRGVVASPEASEGLRVLYACLHLAAVPESEARAAFRRTLKDPDVPWSLKRALSALAASADGGLAALAQIARDEGLLPAGTEDVQSPAVVANIPRIPEGLAALGKRRAKKMGTR